MQKLVIDYLLDGDKRGYNFVTPTDRIAPATVREVWRYAMPRGQGWGAPQYQNARSFKCIPLESGRVAFSEVIVTDKTDEMGRQGIRRAEISIIRAQEYREFVQSLWERLPENSRAQADDKFGFGLWRRVVDRALPRMKGEAQVILAYPYTTPEDWQVMEAVVFKLAMAGRIRLMTGFGKVNPFTTLALDYHEESRIVAVPLEAAQSLQPTKGVSIIDLT